MILKKLSHLLSAAQLKKMRQSRDKFYGAINQLACHPYVLIGIFDEFNSANNFWLTNICKTEFNTQML
jgi:hypothetical protein